MPIYEFMCPKGHITEALVGIGTAVFPCEECLTDEPIGNRPPPDESFGRRIFSPTRTSFIFNDSKLKS